MSDTSPPSTSIRMPGTPKPWMNAMMRRMLRTPGLRSLLGKQFALLTVTGARTGTQYTLPVQPFSLDEGADDERLVVLSQRHRRWWRNIGANPNVRVEHHGRTVEAHAEIAPDALAHGYVERILRENPRVAKFYKIARDDNGAFDPDGVAELVDRTVVILLRM